MKMATFTDFRNHASEYFDEIEKGEDILILRHGKPIAKIVPITEEMAEASWKRPALRLRKKGVALSDELLKDRRKSK